MNRTNDPLVAAAAISAQEDLDKQGQLNADGKARLARDKEELAAYTAYSKNQ